MRKKLAAVFLLLVMWQLLGVSAWFEFSRIAIRKEIKTQLKPGVPDKDLVQFSFTSIELKKLNWIKHNEFSLNGRLYDVVHRSTNSKGFILLKCIDDIKEKELFASLGESTADNLGNDQHPTPLSFCVKQLFSPIEYVGFEGFTFTLCKADLSNHTFSYLRPFIMVVLEKESPPPCTFS